MDYKTQFANKLKKLIKLGEVAPASVGGQRLQKLHEGYEILATSERII